MMFLRALTRFLHKQFADKTLPPRPSRRLRLENLEDRLTPSFTGTAATYTNAVVSIAPNISALSVTETVTATVKTVPSYDPTTGTTTPVPAGASTPSGTVLFNLNNLQASATLNTNGQATASFQLPLLAVFTSQTLEVDYLGTPLPNVSAYGSSVFLAPLYKNFDNLLLPATLSFGTLTPQQQFGSFSNLIPPTQTSLVSFYTAQGEKDDFGLFSYQYVDPGIINTVTALGRNFPGIFALALDAYAGISTSSSSK